MASYNQRHGIKTPGKPGAPKGVAKKTAWRKFAKAYVENSGNGIQAYRTSHPDTANISTAGSRAYDLLKKPEIIAMIQAYEKKALEEAPKSLQKLADLRDGSDSERIQLDSSSTLINAYNVVSRFHKPDDETTKRITNNILVMNIDDAELRRRIQELAGEE